MIKILSQLRMEGNFLNLIKGVYKKSTAEITLNSERLDAFALRLGMKQECPLSSLLHIVVKVMVRAARQEQAIKCAQIGKEIVKWCLFKEDKIVSVENPTEQTKSYQI